MLLLGMGLTQQGGYMQFCDMQAMYSHCAEEDHDITPLDFVFEHLLNLESIVNLLEGEYDYHHGDHPHTPAQSAQSVAGFNVALPHTISFDIMPRFFPAEGITYAIGKGPFYTSRTGSNIFRPPISC